tara:strand:+ start:775 stop:1170 length:396 start_codon:yes stop_codon:yes gene_type:complete
MSLINLNSPFRNNNLNSNNSDEVVRFDLDHDPTKGGSIPGMFAIPMGIYNRYSDYKEDFNKRQREQSKIKLKKMGFDSFEDGIESYKFNLREGALGNNSDYIPSEYLEKSSENPYVANYSKTLNNLENEDK